MAHEVLERDDLKLSEKCWQCGGEGVIAVVPKRRDTVAIKATEECDICNGKGGWPTDFGNAVLEFLKKYGD
jgi:DnaJ-class molecular chaperone